MKASVIHTVGDTWYAARATTPRPAATQVVSSSDAAQGQRPQQQREPVAARRPSTRQPGRSDAPSRRAAADDDRHQRDGHPELGQRRAPGRAGDAQARAVARGRR